MQKAPIGTRASLASLVMATRFHKAFTNFPPRLIHIERGVSQVISRGVPLTRSSKEKTPDGSVSGAKRASLGRAESTGVS